MENTATKQLVWSSDCCSNFDRELTPTPQFRNSHNLIWVNANATKMKTPNTWWSASSSKTEMMIPLCGIILSLVILNLLVILRDFYSSFHFIVSISKSFLRFLSYSWSAKATAERPTEKCCTRTTGDDETAETNDHNRNLSNLLQLRKMLEGISLGRSFPCRDHLSADEIAGVFVEEEPSLMEVKEAFDVFDENKDGFIDAKELRNVLVSLGFVKESNSEQDCKRMIQVFDENLDGRIDFSEFVNIMDRSFC